MWTLHETKVMLHFEYFRRDGAFIGYVCQFNKGDKIFAWTLHAKVGEFKTLGEAKDAIEELA